MRMRSPLEIFPEITELKSGIARTLAMAVAGYSELNRRLGRHVDSDRSQTHDAGTAARVPSEIGSSTFRWQRAAPGMNLQMLMTGSSVHQQRDGTRETDTRYEQLLGTPTPCRGRQGSRRRQPVRGTIDPPGDSTDARDLHMLPTSLVHTNPDSCHGWCPVSAAGTGTLTWCGSCGRTISHGIGDISPAAPTFRCLEKLAASQLKVQPQPAV